MLLSFLESLHLNFVDDQRHLESKSYTIKKIPFRRLTTRAGVDFKLYSTLGDKGKGQVFVLLYVPCKAFIMCACSP